MNELHKFCGIDYGSKLAGTTAIAFADSVGVIHLLQSAKKQDADRMILDFFLEHPAVDQAFIDAPLSLPLVYSRPADGADFFYREADRQLRAMSPLFLGGLTARAMQLAHLSRPHAGFREVYPAALADRLAIRPLGYKKPNGQMTRILEKITAAVPGIQLHTPPANWHQLDALLAWVAGYRYLTGSCERFGNASEGWILV